jgi:hypothetical protein
MQEEEKKQGFLVRSFWMVEAVAITGGRTRRRS